MKSTCWFFLLALLAGCTQHFDHVPDPQIARGLFSPVNLNPDTTIIYISDFIPDNELVDSVSFQSIEKNSWQRSSNKILIKTPEDLPMLSTMNLWVGDTPYSLLLKKSQKQKVILIYDPGSSQHGSVRARGEFNRWNARSTQFELIDGMWVAEILVNPGTYQYLLVINGEQALDPGNPDSVNNNMGGFNSVLSVGTGAEQAPWLFTDEIDEEEIDIETGNELDQYFVFWQNFKLPCSFIVREVEGDIEIKLPGKATQLKRSFIRVWSANKHGYSNELLIPLEYGRVLKDPSLLSRNEQQRMILYNVFVDRFNNGDPANDRPVDDPDILPPANYHGGDISGVIQKVKDGYFNELGINAIWLSPVVLNPEGSYGYWPDPPSKFSAYHGYWPISFTRIDPRFGTAGQLHKLVRVAHEHNLNVLLDIVANHVHEEHPVYRQHPDWATDLYLPDGTLNTEKWDEYRLTTWFDIFLPTLDLAKPAVYNMLSDSAVWWIKEYKLDGFRHDATKHIPEIFWRTLTYKLKTEVAIPEQRDLYQLGETYGSPELISSYICSGMLDGQFDFNVYDEALASIIRPDESFERLNTALQRSLKYYGSHNLMGYITGNQDRGRFASYAGGDLLFEEDSKLAGWTRDIGIGDPVAYDKL
ncbi:MAG: alpha-amylase family glycosyl hydrolase, partial [Bacteroidota bacterium]|nr:alpha-amylase family glycosyl hydrolase [Bacteroidota bacterium]